MTTKAIELFAGIGGFRMACDELGIKTIWANDIDKKVTKIYQQRFKDKTFIQGDIRAILNDIPKHQLLTAGFPCQPFSSAGKKQGISDPRGTLFEVVVQILQTHLPDFFVLENVKRLLSMEQGQHFATILNSLSSLGYLIEWRLLNAKHFGLPQNRERIIIIGSKHLTQIKSFLATREDISSLSSSEINRIANTAQWIKITQHGEKFPNWGLAYQNEFIGYPLNQFSDAKKLLTLKHIIQPQVDSSFDFTEDTIG